MQADVSGAAGYFLDELFRTDPRYPALPTGFLFAGREVAGTESNNSILLLEPKDVPSVNEYFAGLDDDFVPRAREAQAGPNSPYFRPGKPVRGFATLEAELAWLTGSLDRVKQLVASAARDGDGLAADAY